MIEQLKLGIEGPHIAESKEMYRRWFKDQLVEFNPDDQRRLLNCFGYAHDAHRATPMRDEGVPYIVHPVRATVLLIRAGIRDINILRAALLHDTIEDSDYVVSRKLPFEERMRKAQAELSTRFGSEVAEIVVALTKRKEKDIKDRTKTKQEKKEEADRLNWEALTASKDKDLVAKILVTKMGDRFQNLLTLEFISEERQRKNLTETKNKLIPLFRDLVISRYPQLAEMFNSMITVMIQGWKRLEEENDHPDFILELTDYLLPDPKSSL